MTESILTSAGIRLNRTASSREEAVRLAGDLLVGLGAVRPAYVDGMWERELLMSSFIGEATAIPHGTDASRVHVNFAQLALLRFTGPVDWDGDDVRLVIGIASANDDHVETLGRLAEILLDDQRRTVLFHDDDPDAIARLIGKAFDD